MTGLSAICAGLLLAGCGGGGNELVVLEPTGPPPTRPVTSQAPTSAPSPGAKPTVTVQPAAGLHDGDVVHVTGANFTPGKTYVVAECGDKGDKTGQGDCDIPSLVPATADGSGTVQADLPVKVGPFGANDIVCNSTQPCLINVSEATPNPTQQADARISFAG